MKINCYLLFYQFLKSRWCARQDGSSTITTRQDLRNSRPPKEACSAADFRIHGRALHYSFKVGDRKRTIRFYREILGMKILRHEEFSQGCEDDRDNRWSKTMVGYGAEDDYFAFELTYNYPVHNYLKGNEFISVTIRNRDVINRAKAHRWPILDGNILEAPGGFRFHILDEPQPSKEDPVVKVTLACSDYKKSLHYWHGVLGLILFERDNKKKSILVGFKSNEVKLEFQQIEQPVHLGEQSGRIYFSCPHYQQPEIGEKVRGKGFKVLVPLIPLETPKATVRVIILSDPDGHEVCFVEDLAFRHLSQYSPEDEEDLDRHIAMENEIDNIIGEPAKRAEFKQIEDSVKKAHMMQHKGDIKKNVSITLPITDILSRESESERSRIEPDDEKTYEKFEMRKMTVLVTKYGSKEKMLPRRLPKSKIKDRSDDESESSIELTVESSETVQKVPGSLPTSITMVCSRTSNDFFKFPSKSSKYTSPSNHWISTRSDEIEDAVKKIVTNQIEEINSKVSENLEATVNKVVSEKINETVQKAVSVKIEETVAKAVAEIEDSLKKAMANNLPIIEEETLHEDVQQTDPKRPKRCTNLFTRRPTKNAIKIEKLVLSQQQLNQ